MFTVTAPLIQVATKDGPAVQVTKGGPVPSNITDEALANLIDLGFVEEAPDAPDPDAGPESDRVDDVKAWVGDDLDRAETTLLAELEKPEADRRKTLVEDLEKILDSAK